MISSARVTILSRFNNLHFESTPYPQSIPFGIKLLASFLFAPSQLFIYYLHFSFSRCLFSQNYFLFIIFQLLFLFYFSIEIFFKFYSKLIDIFFFF